MFIQGGGAYRLFRHFNLPNFLKGFNLNYSPNYNGSEVVEKSNNNIVLVNFNWRVGVYGFLAGQPMKNFGDLNVGLLDQLALLEWVQDHIHQVCSISSLRRQLLTEDEIVWW